jgi:hypothetical protein
MKTLESAEYTAAYAPSQSGTGFVRSTKANSLAFASKQSSKVSKRGTN